MVKNIQILQKLLLKRVQIELKIITLISFFNPFQGTRRFFFIFKTFKQMIKHFLKKHVILYQIGPSYYE